MYKIIIADDEVIFREYLSNLIDWESYGFEVCCEAKNSFQVLEMAERIKPDIALIDINMPGMDGLILSEKLKEKYDDIGIILVSGYNEFEYAKKAIKIGIEDYILKPFNENELLAALLKVKGKLEKQLSEKNKDKDIHKIIRERALNMLLENTYSLSNEEIRKQHEQLKIKLEGTSFIVSTIEIDNLYQKWSSVSKIVECKYTVSNIVNNIIKINGSHIAFNGPENRIISIIGLSDDGEIDEYNTEIYQNACDFIMKYFDFTISIGIGTLVSGMKLIRDSYLNSLIALRNKTSVGMGKVIKYSEIKTIPKNLGFYPNKINEKLIMFLRLNDFKHIKKELDNVFDFCIKNKLSSDCNFAIVMGLKSVCLSYITEMDKNIEDVLGNDFSPMRIINQKVSIETAHQITIELFEKTAKYFSGRKLTKTKKNAEMVKEYIDINYKNNDLNLEKIAKNLFLNSDYLRRVFRKELNVTLTEYIMSIRMQKAKELVDNGSIKLTDLCYEVGINDPSYLSKCFKRYYGLSPREYENMKENK